MADPAKEGEDSKVEVDSNIPIPANDNSNETNVPISNNVQGPTLAVDNTNNDSTNQLPHSVNSNEPIEEKSLVQKLQDYNNNPQEYSDENFHNNLLNEIESKAQAAKNKIDSGREKDLTNDERVAFQQKLNIDKQKQEQEAQANSQKEQLELQKEQEAFLKTLNPILRRQFESGLGDKELITFHQQVSKDLEAGAKQVLQITDTHMSAEDLERVIKQNMITSNFNPKRDVMIHTGDVIEDLFDMSLGIEAFDSDRIVSKGKLTGEDEREFRSVYREFLNYAGLDEESFRTTRGLQGEEGGALIKMFNNYFLGLDEPGSLSDSELVEFRKTQEKLYHFVRKAIVNHARGEYGKVKKILEEKLDGMSTDNVVMIPGNHDVPEVMNEVLGDYVLKPGEVREVNGVNFTTHLTGSNGEVLGPHLSDIFGVQDVNKAAKTRYESKSFKKLLEVANDNGLEIDNKNLDDLFSKSKFREAYYGLRTKGSLTDYFERRIQPEIDHTIDRTLKSIPLPNLSNVDVVLTHAQLTHPTHASMEERYLHQHIAGATESGEFGGLAYNGHEHGNTTHVQDGVFYGNSGSTASNQSQVSMIKKNDRGRYDLKLGIFNELDRVNGDIKRRIYDRDSVRAKDSNNTQKAA